MIGIGAALLLGLVARLVWPLADPADRLSWSQGVYTDPAVVVHAARNAVLFGEWIRDASRDFVFFPLHNAMTWLAFRCCGTSRLTTQLLSGLLGALTVAGIAWGVGRCRGARAALTAAVLGASCYWLTMFARIPVTENLVVALLTLAAGLALSPGPRSGDTGAAADFAAGFVAGVAVLFGKFHAAPFVVALLVFRGLRAGRWRALVAPTGGLVVAAALWGILIFRPYRTEILDQFRRAPALYPEGRIADLLQTIRTSWLFYRAPILGGLGAIFAIWTVGNRDAWRRRLANGSALFALWFLAGWLYLTLLPYKPPRYFLLVAPALVAAAVFALRELAAAKSLTIRPPRGRLEHVCLGVTLYLVLFATLDSLRHWLGILADFCRVPGCALRNGIVRALDVSIQPLHHLGVAAVAALVLAIGAYVVTMRLARATEADSLRARLRRLPPARLAAGLIALILVINLGQYFAWAGRRIYGIEEAKSSLDGILDENAVLLGAFAPVLVQDSRRTAVFQYAGPDAGVFAEHDVTHVVLSRPGELEAFRETYPELIERMPTLVEWPLRASHIRGLRLFGFPFTARPDVPTDYRPTLYEEGVAALEAGDIAAAHRLLIEFDRNTSTPIPDALSAAARARYQQGDVAGARQFLEEAVRRRPTSSADLFNLGNLLWRQGDTHGAQAAWRRGLALDPYDTDMREAYSSSIQNSQPQ